MLQCHTKYVKKILPEDSIIQYRNVYYIIDKKLETQYEIKNIELETENTLERKKIHHFDCEIIQIPFVQQKNIKTFNEFRIKYNETIEYLNKYKKVVDFNFRKLQFDCILQIIDLKCGITMRHLYNALFHLKKTQEHTLQIHNILINPFEFIREEIQLISYLIAKKICDQLNIAISFKIICEKWSFYHIIHTYNSFYVDEITFYNDFRELCNKNNKKYADYLNIINSVTIKKNIDGKQHVTTQYLYDYEKKLSSTLIDLYSDESTDIDYDSIDEYIVLFEEYKTKNSSESYLLDAEQKTAVKNALTNSLSIITGFPGTGKSSIVECILFILNYINDENNNVSIMSPTGLAYVNIKNKCKCSYKINDEEVYLFNEKISGTCHKTLYNIFPNIVSKMNKNLSDDDYDDDYDDDNDDDKHFIYHYYLEGKKMPEIVYIPKTIIVDEFSMMDIFMFNELISFCKLFKVHLILVGDYNQLPSIGPGCILNSIIETNKEYELFNITNLIKIKRQDKGSLLTNIIKMTVVGLVRDDFVDESMQFIDISSFLNKNNTINDTVLLEFIKLQNFDNQNCKFLSYFNGENAKSKAHPTNVLDLNNILQCNFNPTGLHLEKRPFDTFSYRLGDIIIRTENETTENGFRANGEQAKITEFNLEKKEVTIQYLDNEEDVIIKVDKFYNEFKLAYALTVHKSQGSQYENIVIFVEPNSYVWDKPALYTAISRATKKCFIISDYTEFLKVQKNNKSSKKPTMFLKEIEEMYDCT
jgi:hypothetical protein